MELAGDNSYNITGKVCLPKLPMENIASCNWNMLEPALLEPLFNETSVLEKRASSSASSCALSFQASLLLSSDGKSHSSIVRIPYFFCNFCDHHTDSKAQLLQHLTTKHVFKCKLCSFISVTRFELTQHQIRKHQDSEEVQCILGSRILQMNLSLIQRNLQHFSHFWNDSSKSVNLGLRADGSISSSHLNIIKDFQPRCRTSQSKDGNNSMPLELNQTIDTYDESPDGSKWGVVSNPHNVIRASKRCHSPNVQLDENEYFAKKFRDNADMHHRETDNASLNSSSSLPHFLNDSNSGVALSNNTTPLSYFQEDESENGTEINHSNSQRTMHNEDFVHSEGVEVPKSEEVSDSNPSSKLSTVRKILQCFDKFETKAHTNAGWCSPSIPGVQLGFSKGDSALSGCGLERAPCDIIGERISSSDLLSISEKGFENEFEEDMPESQGFSFLDSNTNVPVITQHRNQNKQSECSSLSMNSKVNSVATKRSFASLNYTQDLDNFLIPSDHGDIYSSGSKCENIIIPQEYSSSSKDEKSYDESNGLQTNLDERKRYDILRRLLVGSAMETNINKQQTEVAGSGDSFHNPDCSQSKKDRHGLVHSLSKASDMSQHVSTQSEIKATDTSQNDAFAVMAEASAVSHHVSPLIQMRASDMSLKDLLTQNLPSTEVSPLVFPQCGNCSTEFSSKVQYQKHVKQCEYISEASPAEAVPFHRFRFSGQTMPECTSKPADLTCSSKRLPASDVLKGLSQHYSKNLGMSNDINSHDKEDEFMSSEIHTQSRDKAHDLGTNFGITTGASEKQDQGNRSSRMKGDFDFIFGSDDSTCSVTSDLDTNGKSQHGHEIKQELVKEENTYSSKLWIPQNVGFETSCLYCSFSTQDKTVIKQHLIERHSKCASFTNAILRPGEKTLLYLCKGVHSQCTYISDEGSEIFEHIRLCYSGHLDNFTSGQTPQDYSEVLLSLGMASRLFSRSLVAIYCLTCGYSDPELNEVANHVSANHASCVAGVLSVSNISEDTKVKIICIVCSADVAVKKWALHMCRLVSKGEDIEKNIASEPILKSNFFSHHNDQPSFMDLNSGANNICRTESGSEKKVHADQKLQIVNSSQNASNSLMEKDYTSAGSYGLSNATHESNFDAVRIKQEVCEPDIVEIEASDDVHFSDEVSTFSKIMKCSNSGNSNSDSLSYSSPNCIRTSSRPSVLQNLLTAPRDAEFAPACFSLLQKLLKPPDTLKDKEQMKSSFIRQSRSTSRPSSPSTTLQAKASCTRSSSSCASSPRPANTNAQYPCILEMLSRQDTAVKQSSVVNGNSCSKFSPSHSDTDLSHVSHYHLDSEQSFLSSLLPISSVCGQNIAKTKHLPELSTNRRSSTVPSSESLSPSIPQPPTLPYFSPLSPSPPLPSSSSSLTVENQSAPGPFTNLLRLLSRSSPNKNP